MVQGALAGWRRVLPGTPTPGPCVHPAPQPPGRGQADPSRQVHPAQRLLSHAYRLQIVRMRVVVISNDMFIRLEDSDSHELFAECPLPSDGTPFTTVRGCHAAAAACWPCACSLP